MFENTTCHAFNLAFLTLIGLKMISQWFSPVSVTRLPTKPSTPCHFVTAKTPEVHSTISTNTGTASLWSGPPLSADYCWLLLSAAASPLLSSKQVPAVWDGHSVLYRAVQCSVLHWAPSVWEKYCADLVTPGQWALVTESTRC